MIKKTSPCHDYVITYIYIYIPASVIFLDCSVAFYLSLQPWRSVGRSNFDWGLLKRNYVDSNNDIQNINITILYIYISKTMSVSQARIEDTRC